MNSTACVQLWDGCGWEPSGCGSSAGLLFLRLGGFDLYPVSGGAGGSGSGSSHGPHGMCAEIYSSHPEPCKDAHHQRYLSSTLIAMKLQALTQCMYKCLDMLWWFNDTMMKEIMLTLLMYCDAESDWFLFFLFFVQQKAATPWLCPLIWLWAHTLAAVDMWCMPSAGKSESVLK